VCGAREAAKGCGDHERNDEQAIQELSAHGRGRDRTGAELGDDVRSLLVVDLDGGGGQTDEASTSRGVRVRVAIVAVAAAVLFLVAACGGGDSGGSGASAQPPLPRGALAKDSQVLAGRKVFAAYCATCHGISGGGGVGPSFSDGKLLTDFPTAQEQVAFVSAGKGVMPSFSSLGPRRLEAVVRYEREVLSGTKKQ
jgi:mono/diheme cytochrome c family protein